MHQLLASLFSLLVALCHAITPTPSAAHLPLTVHLPSADALPGAVILPDRYQLAVYASTDLSYAGTACVSCRRTEESTTFR